MRSILRMLTVAFLSALLQSTGAFARDPAPPAPGALPLVAAEALSERVDTLFLFAASGPGSVGSPGTDARGFTFDYNGGPAEAGWFGVDLTVDDGLWWHVATTSICAGTGTDMSAALPFDTGDTVNDYALWCGGHDVCSWVHTSGYGLGWDQYAVLDLSGHPVDTAYTVSFAYRSDFEGDGYDWFELRAEVDDQWVTVYEDQTVRDRTYRELSIDVPAGTLGGPGASARVAFYFHSDGAWCDEDGLFPTEIGAVWIDNLRASADGAEVFASDFEDGLVPAGLSFGAGSGAGDWAALRAGVAQPEGDHDNGGWFWTFFDPSLANPDYPDGVVPYGPPYLFDMIESPDLAVDQNGAPYVWQDGDHLFVEAWIYDDMPLDSWITSPLPQVAAITADGCTRAWRSNVTITFPPGVVGWTQVGYDMTSDLLSSADGEPIVGLRLRASGVRDVAGIWGPPYGEHAAGPFVDNVSVYVSRATSTEVGEAPAATALRGAYPNPFNPSTAIAYSMAEAGRASLSVYDLAGHRVVTLLDGPAEAGAQQLRWDGRDDAGRRLASGVYLVRFEAGGVREEEKLILIK